MSFSTVVSAATEGLAVEFVHVEADVSNGLPVFHMVGYLASEVKEAGERVRTAIKNSDLIFRQKGRVSICPRQQCGREEHRLIFRLQWQY